MIELFDANPQIQVQPAEYARLLGFPRGHQLEGRALELSEWAGAWYAAHCRPWIYGIQARSLEMIDGSIIIDGTRFSSPRLYQRLANARAHGVILAAVSAGPETENEAQRFWQDEKPDEYFFLDIYASAVVEHLTMQLTARLCTVAQAHSISVLPHESPGYEQWDVGEQPKLLELILSAGAAQNLPALAAMESGMLRPRKSQLMVFGLTKQTRLSRALTDLSPCANCSFSPCRYRRDPLRRQPKGTDHAQPILA
jgi:hypothetical protein